MLCPATGDYIALYNMVLRMAILPVQDYEHVVVIFSLWYLVAFAKLP